MFAKKWHGQNQNVFDTRLVDKRRTEKENVWALTVDAMAKYRCVCVCEWVRERMLNAWLIINHTNSAVQWAPNCMVVLFNVIKKERFCCNNWMLPCGGFSPTGHSPDSDPDACTAPWGASNTFLSWNPAWCAALWFLVDKCFYQEHTINSNSLQCGVFALVFWSSFKVPLGKCGYN